MSDQVNGQGSSGDVTVPGSSSVELVIFDCDGVLVDSERLAVRVESELITDLGWPISEGEVLERFVGRSDSYMLSELERHLGRSLPEWGGLYNSALHSAFEAELRPVDGIVAALDELDRPSCVASSGTHAKMRFTLGHVGLYERFEGRIFSSTEVSAAKPAPDLFLHAARSCGVAPDRCVVVEDSRSGVEAARTAGMRALGYAGGLTPSAWLEGPATTVFDDMAVLPSLVRALI